MVSKEEKTICTFIQSLKIGKENFEFTDDGLLKDYLGVKFTRHPDGTMELKQEFLIQRVIDSLHFDSKMVNTSNNLATKLFLRKETDGVRRKHDRNFRSVIGMLNYFKYYPVQSLLLWCISVQGFAQTQN